VADVTHFNFSSLVAFAKVPVAEQAMLNGTNCLDVVLPALLSVVIAAEARQAIPRGQHGLRSTEDGSS